METTHKKALKNHKKQLGTFLIFKQLPKEH